MLLTTLQHPAAIIRGQWELADPQVAYLRRIAKAPTRRPVDISEPAPSSNLYPTLRDLEEFHTQARELGWMSLDLETCGDHLICAGMTAFEMEGPQVGATLCLRFRLRSGVLAWNRRELPAIAEAFYDLLSDPEVGKLLHNGINFDLSLLETNGFQVEGPVWDTMALWHTAYSEFPLALQWLSTLFLGMPVWKTLVDVDEDEKETL